MNSSLSWLANIRMKATLYNGILIKAGWEKSNLAKVGNLHKVAVIIKTGTVGAIPLTANSLLDQREL